MGLASQFLRSKEAGTLRGWIMAVAVPQQNGEIRELTPEQGRERLDKLARHYLKISADQFLSAWDRGDYRDEDRPDVLRVAMAIPFARR
jgi:hypothetical protein